mmetsp:Transcript_14772/g.32329  ORF Transcript_14772/g.32329 Transcript_14772/m.32329 type:complete len:295 (-) Transcript_14772:17-901(-)
MQVIGGGDCGEIGGDQHLIAETRASGCVRRVLLRHAVVNIIRDQSVHSVTVQVVAQQLFGHGKGLDKLRDGGVKLTRRFVRLGHRVYHHPLGAGLRRGRGGVAVPEHAAALGRVYWGVYAVRRFGVPYGEYELLEGRHLSGPYKRHEEQTLHQRGRCQPARDVLEPSKGHVGPCVRCEPVSIHICQSLPRALEVVKPRVHYGEALVCSGLEEIHRAGMLYLLHGKVGHDAADYCRQQVAEEHHSAEQTHAPFHRALLGHVVISTLPSSLCLGRHFRHKQSVREGGNIYDALQPD